MPCARVHLCQNALDSFHFLSAKFLHVVRQLRPISGVVHQFFGQLGGGQNHICQAGGDGGARHTVVFSLMWVLHHEQTTTFLDGLDANRPISSSTRKNDGG